MNPVQVRADFDRIAELSARQADRAGPYERWLLRQLPTRLEHALDVGCGAGHMVRQLARRSGQALGIDFSSGMIELAREKSRGISNLKFEIADIMQIGFPPASFDCIVSVATLHHLRAEVVFPRLRDLLRPGGVLGVIDLVRSSNTVDFARDAVAAAMNLAWRLVRPQSRELRQAWAAHGASDDYLSIPELNRLCRQFFPGACVRRRIRWRYSLLWRKPE